MEIKHCSRCDQDKPLTAEYWPVRNDRRNGFRGVCRACWDAQRHTPEYRRRDRQYQLRYYLKNRLARIAANRRYRLRNHERWLEYQRRWNTERRCIDVHLPDVDRWQYPAIDSAVLAVEELQAHLPTNLSDAIDSMLASDEIDNHIVSEIRRLI